MNIKALLTEGESACLEICMILPVFVVLKLNLVLLVCFARVFEKFE